MPVSYYECLNPPFDTPGYVNNLDPCGNYSSFLHWGLPQSLEANRLAVEAAQTKTEHLGVLYRWFEGKMTLALVSMYPNTPPRGNPPWPLPPTKDVFDHLIGNEE